MCSLLAIGGRIKYGSPGQVAIELTLIMVFTAIISLIYLNPRNLIETVKKFGYEIAGIPGNSSAEKIINRESSRQIFPSALFLAAVVALPYILVHYCRYSSTLILLLSPQTVVMCAIILEMSRKIASEKILFFKEHRSPQYQPWMPVCYCETELEGRLIIDILRRNAIDASMRFNRAICIIGSFAVWEICRPTCAFLAIYRGLGNGKVEVLVSQENGQRTAEILGKLRSGA
jgi:hypothetical protein